MLFHSLRVQFVIKCQPSLWPMPIRKLSHPLMLFVLLFSANIQAHVVFFSPPIHITSQYLKWGIQKFQFKTWQKRIERRRQSIQSNTPVFCAHFYSLERCLYDYLSKQWNTQTYSCVQNNSGVFKNVHFWCIGHCTLYPESKLVEKFVNFFKCFTENEEKWILGCSKGK